MPTIPTSSCAATPTRRGANEVTATAPVYPTVKGRKLPSST